MTHPLPAELLEERASEQRKRLHHSVTELRSGVSERLNYRKAARENLWQVAGALALVGSVVGWGFAGMFTHR